MGMSASQARLLSITSRLTNNEFRAQTITNSKLRLASETTQATKAYNEALDSEQLMFMNYDNNGDATKVALTHTLMSEYAPLKNQYILRNSHNKILTTNVDAKNFTETNSLVDFLRRYDLVDGVENSTKIIRTHNPKWDDWKVEHDKWLDDKPDKEDYKVVTPASSERVYTDSVVYDKARSIDCFGLTINHETCCYMHVLNALIGFGEHTTSDGHTFTTYCVDSGSGDPALDLNNLTGERDGYLFDYGWGWNSCESSEYIGDMYRNMLYSDPLSTEPCDGTTITRAENKEVPCRGDGTDVDRYGGYCYQKAVDLLWELHDDYAVPSSSGGPATREGLEKFWYFIEYDLGEWHYDNTEEVVEYPGYDDDFEEWKEKEPKEPPKDTETTEEYISDIIVNDSDKAQWYTNLWHVLNDSETSNTVQYKQLKTSWDEETPEYGDKVSNQDKTVKQDMFEVLDSNLSESSEWLQFALEHGIVSMERATFRNPSEDSYKAMEKSSIGYTWKSIIYTEATDIVSVPDDEAVTKAEVEYKKALKRIKAEDKKFDTDLKKLDTEHSALQAEYDSIKETISKNVQRSFKMFS